MCIYICIYHLWLGRAFPCIKRVCFWYLPTQDTSCDPEVVPKQAPLARKWNQLPSCGTWFILPSLDLSSGAWGAQSNP